MEEAAIQLTEASDELHFHYCERLDWAPIAVCELTNGASLNKFRWRETSRQRKALAAKALSVTAREEQRLDDQADSAGNANAGG